MFQKILLSAFMFMIALSQTSHGAEDQGSLVEKLNKLVQATSPCTTNEEGFETIRGTFKDLGFTEEAAHQYRLGDKVSERIRTAVTERRLSLETIKETQTKLKDEGKGQNELNLLLSCNERPSPISHPILIEIAADALTDNSSILKESGKYLSDIAETLLTTQKGFTVRLLAEIPDETGVKKSMIDVMLGMCQFYGEGKHDSYTIPTRARSTIDVTLFTCFEPEGPFRTNPYNLLHLILTTADQLQNRDAIPSPVASIVSTKEDNSILAQNCKYLHKVLDERLEAIDFATLSSDLARLDSNLLGRLALLPAEKLSQIVNSAHLTSSTMSTK